MLFNFNFSCTISWNHFSFATRFSSCKSLTVKDSRRKTCPSRACCRLLMFWHMIWLSRSHSFPAWTLISWWRLTGAQWSLQTYDDDCSLTCKIEQFFSFRPRFITICKRKKKNYSSVTSNRRARRISRFYRRNAFSCGTKRFLWGDGTCIDKTWISRNQLRWTFAVDFSNLI